MQVSVRTSWGERRLAGCSDGWGVERRAECWALAGGLVGDAGRWECRDGRASCRVAGLGGVASGGDDGARGSRLTG